MTIRERILKYIEYKGISRYKFYQETGFSNGFLDKNGGIGSDKCEKISYQYPDINIEWLITGQGEMLKSEEKAAGVIEFSVSEFKQRGYAPFYSNLPASAGRYDLAKSENEEKAESWIKIPGVIVDIFFPIIGCSMEPKVYAGDVIGVVSIERWDLIDPDRIYLIITRDDRMIKHLEVDETNPEILWAVSENYKRFKIPADNIIKIFRVVWVGRLV